MLGIYPVIVLPTSICARVVAAVKLKHLSQKQSKWSQVRQVKDDKGLKFQQQRVLSSCHHWFVHVTERENDAVTGLNVTAVSVFNCNRIQTYISLSLCRQYRPVWGDSFSVWGTESHQVSLISRSVICCMRSVVMFWCTGNFQTLASLAETI